MGKALRAAGLIVVGGMLIALSIAYARVAHPRDLYGDFLPAARAVLLLRNPYRLQTAKLYYPPWVLLPFLPLAFLPDRVVGAIWFLVGLVAFAYVGYKMGLSRRGQIFFLLSPPVVFCLALGNIDWIPLLGLCVPAPWSLLFFLAKPQVGLGWALVYLYKWWPVSAYILAATVSIGAVALALMGSGLTMAAWNVSLGPDVMTVAVGVYLAFRPDDEQASWVGPLLSPYLSFGSYAGVFLSLAGDWRIVVVVLVSWTLLLVRVFL